MRKFIGKIRKSGIWPSLFPLFLLFSLLPSQVLGQPYLYTDIHPAGWVDSRVMCINGLGEAVGFGTTDSGERGFLWSFGRITEILPPGADSARALWINDSGEIAGTWVKDGVRHAFLLRESTFLDPTPGWGSSEATFVGEDGAVAGRGDYGAYISREGTTEIFPGFSSVAGGNNSGQWVGSSGTSSLLFLPGHGYLDVTPPGATESTPHGINESGIVAVAAMQTGTMKGYVKSGEFYIDMTPSGWSSSRAMAINDFNEVAGYGDSTAGRRSFLRSGGTTEEIAFPGWTSTEAVSLNNDGLVAGAGTTPSGATHAFVASPQGVSVEQVPGAGPSGGGGCTVATWGPQSDDLGSFAGTLAALAFPLLLLRGRGWNRRSTPR